MGKTASSLLAAAALICLATTAFAQTLFIPNRQNGALSVATGLNAGSSFADNIAGNTAFGTNALAGATTGTNNTAIGNGAFRTGNFSNSIAIGANAQPTADNQVVIGNSSTTSAVVYGLPVVQAAAFGIYPSNSGATNNVQIAAALAYLNTKGGGTLTLPCGAFTVTSPISNPYPYVTLAGTGRNPAGITAANTFCTVINAGSGFSGDSVLYRFTNSSSIDNLVNGGGFVDMTVNSNGFAPRLLHSDAVESADYRLTLVGPVTGTENALIETTKAWSTQQLNIDLRVQEFSSAHAVKFAGTANGNVSINSSIRLDVQYLDGNGLDLGNSDNNLIWMRSQRATGGAGRCLVSRANADPNQTARANKFDWLSCTANDGANYGPLVQGTETAATASSIASIFADRDNATPMPTLGTGASAPVINGETSQSVTLSTIGGGSIAGSGVVRWSQSAGKQVTGIYTITLSSAVAGVLIGVTLPIAQNSSVNQGVLGGYDSTNHKALAGFVVSGSPDQAFYTYGDGSFPAAAGATTHNFTVIYEGY